MCSNMIIKIQQGKLLSLLLLILSGRADAAWGEVIVIVIMVIEFVMCVKIV